MKKRIEKDALGAVEVPFDRYFGAHTARALENFQVGDEQWQGEFITAHAIVKCAAAKVNYSFGDLQKKISTAIQRAAKEVYEGGFHEEFPLVIWQSGSGTQTNMNINEVIASRANEILTGQKGGKSPVHPNDHVNMSQSTNDTVPTSINIAGVISLEEKLLPALKNLEMSLNRKSQEFKGLVKIGRTHLQDATPLTLGQEFSGYSAQVEECIRLIENLILQIRYLPIGGTAVGTGFQTRKGYDRLMVKEISVLTGHKFKVAKNKFAGLASHDSVVAVSGGLKTLSVALMKIANDIRWLGSGPRSGLGEIRLPANELGSSIMPGKVNPTQCEMVSMVCCRVLGNDTVISFAGSQGNFELNVFKPVIAHAFIQSINLLSDACVSFSERCIQGIIPEKRQIEKNLSNSLMLVTALNEHIGYDKSAEIALKAFQKGQTLKEAAVESGYVKEKEFDKWVKPQKMITPK